MIDTDQTQAAFTVNGVNLFGLAPEDTADRILTEAHAMLSLIVTETDADGGALFRSNPAIVQTALSGVRTLLELGLQCRETGELPRH